MQFDSRKTFLARCPCLLDVMTSQKVRLLPVTMLFQEVSVQYRYGIETVGIRYSARIVSAGSTLAARSEGRRLPATVISNASSAADA